MANVAQVSVIIPVYNARDYVRQAAESALLLAETGEVILVEDNSPDNALELCQALAQEYDNVILLRHPNGENRGAAASRNLGVEHAKYDLIAFLDADDYYLANRFKTALKMLAECPDLDGVYGAMQMVYMSKEAELEWRERAPHTLETGIMRPRNIVKAEDLHEALLQRNPHIYFSGNALTLRKSAFEKIGGYSIVSRREDLVLCYKLAAKCRIAASENIDEPIVVYRLHATNRGSIRNKSQLEQKLRDLIFYDAIWVWSLNNLDKDFHPRYFALLQSQLSDIAKEYPVALRRVFIIQATLKRFLRHPRVFRQAYSWQIVFKLLNIFGGSQG
jgi:glycosyltransferase involved in cell wall biosynthesis